jgi:farnesyl-diphosphate farnesyltransferase
MHPLLRRVSRSFYLTIRVLPSAIRPQIGNAYLLARATDTIADTEVLPVAARQHALAGLRDSIFAAADGRRTPTPDFRAMAAANEAPARPAGNPERLLLLEIENVLAELRDFEPSDRRRIREVLDTITSGQAMDLEKFGGADAGRITALANDQELEEYTYRVAGCVGEFWTRMCRAHLFPEAALNDAFLIDRGIRFGKGLQLVNILRDLPRDLRHGRCYLPAQELANAGLRPESLLEPNQMPSFRGLYRRYLDRAESYLAAGWGYTNALPRKQVRVRLACAWPILLGAETIARLRAANVLDDRERIKISRGEVRATVFRSVIRYPFPAAWQRLLKDALE